MTIECPPKFLRRGKGVGWLMLVILGLVWYSEHVALRSRMAELSREMAQLQKDYTDTSLLADRSTAKLQQLSARVSGAEGVHGDAVPGDQQQQRQQRQQLGGAGGAAAAPDHPPAPTQQQPPPPPTPPAGGGGGGGCVGWRQTGGCSSSGGRESDHDHDCDTSIWRIWSGYCECSWGNHMGVGNSCVHPKFTCAEACAGGPQWEAPVPPPPPPEDDREVAWLQELEVAVKHLQESDCPAGSAAFYKHIPIVYTWVDGADPTYRQLREKFGGPSSVGGAR
jgi:hypothetical protein